MSCDAFAFGYGLRVNISRRMRKDPARNVIEDARLENLNPCEEQWSFLTSSIIGGVIGRARRRGHSAEACHQAFQCFDDAEAFTLNVRVEDQSRQSFSLLMSAKGIQKIDVCDNLTIDDEKGLAFEQAPGVIECSARA